MERDSLTETRFVAGYQSGRILVLEEIERAYFPSGYSRRNFKVQCECGTVFSATSDNISRMSKNDCQCLKDPLGMSGTRPYQCWYDMVRRCTAEHRPRFEDYGGRGITYCDKWKTFEGFWEDMQEGYSDELSLNRINNNGNYEKANCEWATDSVQVHNRRKRSKTTLKTIGGNYRSRDDSMYARISITVCGVQKDIYLGTFSTEKEIAEAYDFASEILYGDRPNGTIETREIIKTKVKRRLARRGLHDGD